MIFCECIKFHLVQTGIFLAMLMAAITLCMPRIVSADQALSPADAQVLAVFGWLPLNPLPSIVAAGYTCTVVSPPNVCNRPDCVVATDLYSASVACTHNGFGIPGASVFRSDLGIDSAGCVPPSGYIYNIYGAGNPNPFPLMPRCSPLINLPKGCLVNCTVAISCSYIQLSQPSTHTLTITRDGYGTGSSTVDSGGLIVDRGSFISWSSNTGIGSYIAGIQVILSPNPDTSSLFGGWSGGGCTGLGTCIVTMNADITLNVTFNLKPARSAGSAPTYFTTLQGALDGVGGGNTVYAEGIYFPESLAISKPLTLIGGYDGSYSSNNGFTTVQGLTILDGSLTVDKLVID
jgi:hypothetical protein